MKAGEITLNLIEELRRKHMEGSTLVNISGGSLKEVLHYNFEKKSQEKFMEVFMKQPEDSLKEFLVNFLKDSVENFLKGITVGFSNGIQADILEKNPWKIL